MRTEIVRIPVASGQVDALVERIESASSSYLSEPNCVGLRMLRSASGDELLVVVDWASDEAHEAASARPEAQAFFGAVQELATGQPDVGVYQPV